MKNRIILFLTALLQVTFVSMNVIFIANGKILLLTLTGFMISFIWTLNVKKVAFGTWIDRFVYAFGAMLGTLIGYYLSNYLITI